MNFVFWTTITALIIGALVHRRIYLHHQPNQGSHPTPESLPLPSGTTWPIAASEWTIENIEFLASADRLRAVVSVIFAPEQNEARQQCLQLLSTAIYRHTEVQAVFVEVSGVEDAPELFLFAPDGRGW